MHTVAFLTQKGGAGKTTLAASLAVAAAAAGERVIALDFDPQASLARWGKRRLTTKATNRVVVDQFELPRLARFGAIIDGLADAGFTLAVFDTAGADNEAVRVIAERADLCLLPSRPTYLDVEATAATFRAIYLAKRKAAFVLNQCPSTYRGSRASDAAKELSRLGILAEPMLSARIDFQDAVAAGLGVTEHASQGRAAQEIDMLWNWVHNQLRRAASENPAGARSSASLTERLSVVARGAHLR